MYLYLISSCFISYRIIDVVLWSLCLPPHTQRCKMTGIDQSSGSVDKVGPLEVLRSYRAPGGPAHAMFGQLMIPLQSGGRVSLGDNITILEKKKH